MSVKPAITSGSTVPKAFELFTQRDWEIMGDRLHAAIAEDLSRGVKPSTGRRMPRYRDPERSGVPKGARVKLYRTGALYRSFRVRARRSGVRVEAGHDGVYYAWILDRRFRFMTVPKTFGGEAADEMEKALAHNLQTKRLKTKRKRKRATQREIVERDKRKRVREIMKRGRA